MEIRKLEYFEAVSRLESFTKAAKELHIAQPSISNAIKSLEDELETKLLVRNKRNVRLTYEGEIFRSRVMEILNLVSKTGEEMSELNTKKESIINIGLPPMIGSEVLPLLYGEFRKKYPDIKIHVIELGTYGIFDALDEDRIDLGFNVFNEECIAKYEVEPVICGELQVLLSKHNTLASKEAISLEDIAKQKLIHLPNQSYIRKVVDLEFEKNNIKADILIVPEQMVTTINLVSKDLGISFVLGKKFSAIKERRTVTTKPLKNPIKYRAGFTWRKDKTLSGSAKKCIKFMKGRI